jgi:hypothetical protein
MHLTFLTDNLATPQKALLFGYTYSKQNLKYSLEITIFETFIA